METVLGIDEAGRGPVIGPLVIAGIRIKESNIKKLQELGVRDSKQIAPKKREFMYDKIIDIVDDYEILIIPPKEIDEALNSDNLNLNWLEAIKSAIIINKLKPNKAILDCPSTNIAAYKNYLSIYLKDNSINIICEHKADENYPSVSAASILAKVVRDKKVKELAAKYGDLGSGYPSDPKTQKFLKLNWEKYPEIFRRTWSSYKRFSKKKSQKSLKEF
ncbi:MAG: ribonuclease HII [Nanoarchaeota archaeon]|nr:ribonuclease HII [Nanoarchaeota archaeon]